MSPSWLTEDLWRAHVSWLNPPWVGSTTEGRGDFDAVRWLDTIQAAHYRTLIFYVKHHDGFLAYPSRFSTAQPERDFLGEIVAEARRRDVRVVTYFSTFLDEVTGNEHPDWRVVDRAGEPAQTWASTQWPGAYCCLNNPGYRATVLGQLTELRDVYHTDGFWMDVFEPMIAENCFCPSCRALYSAQTGLDLLDTYDNAWYWSCLVDFMGEIRKIAGGSDRPCIVAANTGSRSVALDNYTDLLTHEAFTSPMISAFGRSARPQGKPFETTCRLYSAIGTYAMRGHDRVLLESLAAVVHGGACCQEFSPTQTGRFTAEAAHRVTQVGGYIRGIEEYLVGAEPIYDAAVLLPANEYGSKWEVPQPAGWGTVLVERDIPFAYVYPDADLTPYRLVILDGRVALDESLARKVADYVAQGGNLLVECDAAAWDTPAGATMAEVLGITSFGKAGGRAQYLSALSPDLATDMGADDLIVEGDAYAIALNGAEALACYCYEFASHTPDRRTYRNMAPAREASHDPAITVNQHGSGRALYIACPLTTSEVRAHRHNEGDLREYPTLLAANVARFMVGEPLLRGTTPSGVELVVNRQGSRTLVHLLNHYAGNAYPDPRPGSVRLADVTVSINATRLAPVKAASLVTDSSPSPLLILRDGPWLDLTLPSLGVHALVVLEH